MEIHMHVMKEVIFIVSVFLCGMFLLNETGSMWLVHFVQKSQMKHQIHPFYIKETWDKLITTVVILFISWLEF